jgi:protein EFR3
LQENNKSEAIVDPENGYTQTEPDKRKYSGGPCLNEHYRTAFNDEV